MAAVGLTMYKIIALRVFLVLILNTHCSPHSACKLLYVPLAFLEKDGYGSLSDDVFLLWLKWFLFQLLASTGALGRVLFNMEHSFSCPNPEIGWKPNKGGLCSFQSRECLLNAFWAYWWVLPLQKCGFNGFPLLRGMNWMNNPPKQVHWWITNLRSTELQFWNQWMGMVN